MPGRGAAAAHQQEISVSLILDLDLCLIFIYFFCQITNRKSLPGYRSTVPMHMHMRARQPRSM